MANDPTVPAATPTLRGWLRGLVLPAWLFVLLALLLLPLLILLQSLVIVSLTYGGSDAPWPQHALDRGWALLLAAALLWALVNLYWSACAVTEGDSSEKPAAVFGHLALAIGCGLIAMGIGFVMAARYCGTQAIVMDYSRSGRAASATSETETLVVAGDPVEGRKVFSTTCITCHGAGGGGLPNLAPSLRGSPFIATADDAALARVIRAGRAATDPDNKTQKVMPARGGNPFLADDKIAHLVAFVRAIQSERGNGDATESDPNALPPVQLAKWVVPDAVPPPEGMIRLEDRAGLGDEESIVVRDRQRRRRLVQAFTISLTGLHCLFLVGVMVASSSLLLRGLESGEGCISEPLWRWSTLGWIVAAVVWFVIFVFGFLM